MVALLVCGLALGCLILLPGGADATIEDLSEPGPYKVGFVDDNMTVTTVIDWLNLSTHQYPGANPPGTKYDGPVRFFYPAIEDGEGATPNRADAPYVTIFYDPDPLLFHEDYDLLTHLASHGMVVVTFGPLYTKWGAVFEYIDHFRDRVWQVENLTMNASSVLYDMVDVDAMGTTGRYNGGMSTGSMCVWLPQLKATVKLAPYTPNPEGHYQTDPIWGAAPVRDNKVMIMVGAKDPTTRTVARIAYNAYTSFMQDGGAVSLFELPEANESGPWALDLIVAFFLHHLDGREEYGTWLFGHGMLQNLADGQYSVWFRISEDEFFPPEASIISPISPVYMEHSVELRVEFIGYDVTVEPGLTVDWYVNSDPDVIESKEHIVDHAFMEPQDRCKVTAKWSLGVFDDWAFTFYIEVVNMPPVAIAGSDLEVDMDEEFVLDGSMSWDTPSHNDSLEFKWSISQGEGTEYSTDPTLTLTFTETRVFEAMLTVRDPLGAESSAICNITVKNVVPSVSPDAKTEALEDEKLQFGGAGTDSVSHLGSLVYKWDFGDGIETEWVDAPEGTHVYTESGTFTAVLWVKDPLEAMASGSLVVTVENVVPQGEIDRPKDKYKAQMDEKVRFIGRGWDTESDNGSLKLTWDFGDGRTAEGTEVSHAYKDSGTFKVTLTVEDDDGATYEVTHTINIQDSPGFGAVIAVLAMTLAILFTASRRRGR